MPTISAKIIKHPRKRRACDACGHAITGESARLFGSCEGDKPYVVYMHPACVQDKGSLQKLYAVEHNAHLTPESLATSQAVVNAEASEQSDGDSSPAQAQVAQTVQRRSARLDKAHGVVIR